MKQLRTLFYSYITTRTLYSSLRMFYFNSFGIYLSLANFLFQTPTHRQDPLIQKLFNYWREIPT